MSRFTKLAVGAAAAVLLIAAAGGATLAILTLTAGRGTVLDHMVPSDAAGYASINLDPPADQKLDLLQLSRKFPDLGSQANLEKNLDQTLHPLGLAYTSDVKPWLGAQVVAVAAGTRPDVAVLLDSRDDAKAQAALAKVRTGPKGRGASWRTSHHGGVTLETGELGGSTAVLAYFDHTVLLATSDALASEVIDTDQGKHARLDGTAEYRTITGRLPSSRLVTVFVGAAGFQDLYGKALHGVASALPTNLPATGFHAYRGFAAAVAAKPDGLTADFEVDVDVARLPAAQQAIYKRAGRADAALTWMPASASGVVATTKLDALAAAATSVATGALPSESQQLQQQGITGPGSILASLTGDAALEVEATPSGSQLALGAVVGTSEPQKLSALVNQLSGQASSSGFQVTAATDGQYLLVATSPDELARLRAAHSGGGSIASAAAFKEAQDYAVADPDTLLFVDVQSALHLAGRLGLDSNTTFQDESSKWSAARALLVTGGVTPAGGSTRLRLLVS